MSANNEKDPKPEDYSSLGISCPSGHEAVDVTYEHNSISDDCPNGTGKHRWSYRCKNPETGKIGDVEYTNWICND